MKQILLFFLLSITILTKGQEIKYVTATSLNIRQGEGIKYPIIMSISEGDSLKVKSENNGWSKVETFSGETGYVSTKYLTEQRKNNTSNKPESSWVGTLITLGVMVYLFFKVRNWFLGIFNPRKYNSRTNTSKTSNSRPVSSKKEVVSVYLSTVKDDGTWIKTYDSNGKHIETKASGGERVVGVASDFYVTQKDCWIKTYNVNCKHIKTMGIPPGEIVINAAGNTFTTKKDVWIKTYDKQCKHLNTRTVHS